VGRIKCGDGKGGDPTGAHHAEPYVWQIPVLPAPFVETGRSGQGYNIFTDTGNKVTKYNFSASLP